MNKFKRVLAIETSCDDTSVAIIETTGHVIFCESANQDDVHAIFGGIVPEIAGRNHTENLLPIVNRAFVKSNLKWDDIDALAVTCRPGLVGSLLVGVVTVKALALARNIPFIGVNHLEGHLLAPFLKDASYAPPRDFDYPYIALAVSGGHTSLYQVNGLGMYETLGRTIDDAAGEAFDKFAKMVGLGFPGGVHVDRLSKTGNTRAYDFPRALLQEDTLNFSFSGLKSSALRQLQTMSDIEISERLSDLCASYQEAVVDALISKLALAVEKTGIGKVVITGGVSANSRLREAGEAFARKKGLAIVIPPIRYCTDNAAMIGYAGIQRLSRGERSDYSLGVSPEVNV